MTRRVRFLLALSLLPLVTPATAAHFINPDFGRSHAECPIERARALSTRPARRSKEAPSVAWSGRIPGDGALLDPARALGLLTP
jgi:hypothetical protein